jgi:sigma-B regulation protein RsbU (phosphoserine phosphatase)
MLYDAPIQDFLNGQKQDLYKTYFEEMKKFTKAFDLKYFYVYVPDIENDKLIPVIGIDGETGKSIENYNLGEPLQNIRLNPLVVNMYVNKGKRLAIEMNNEFGHVFTGYSTIMDKNGNPIAVMGADFDYQYLLVELIRDCSIIFFFIFFALLIMYFLGIFFIQKTFIKPILHLSTELSRYFTHGADETGSISLSTNDELNIIADLCNGMALEKKRIENELNIAKKIQMSVLPMVFPPFPNSKEFDVFADISTAKEVGGDFYDFFFVGVDRFVFLIADVCGKGVPAALFMMQAKSLLANMLQTGMDIEDAVNKVNGQICENNKESYFVTAFIASINLSTGDISFVNCGHNTPLIKRANGEFEYIETKRNIVLGITDGYKYKKTDDKLNKDDLMYLYTDGVTEAMNKTDALYGEEKLKTVLNTSKDAKIEDIIKNVENDVAEFSKDTEQSDDITSLIFKYNGK